MCKFFEGVFFKPNNQKETAKQRLPGVCVSLTRVHCLCQLSDGRKSNISIVFSTYSIFLFILVELICGWTHLVSFKRCVARYIQTVSEYSLLHFSHIRHNFSLSSLQSDAFFRVNASASARDDDNNVFEQHHRLFVWENKLKKGMCPKMTTEKKHKTKQKRPRNENSNHVSMH